MNTNAGYWVPSGPGNPSAPQTGTRLPLSPDSFGTVGGPPPAQVSTPLGTEPPLSAAQPPQLKMILEGLRAARHQLDSSDPETLQAGHARAAFCVGFLAGGLSTQGLPLPALATVLPEPPKLTDALDLLIQILEQLIQPTTEPTRLTMAWSWDGCLVGGAAAASVAGIAGGVMGSFSGPVGYVGGAAGGLVVGAVVGCIAGGVAAGIRR